MTAQAFLSPKCAPKPAVCEQSMGGLDLIVIDYLQLMTASTLAGPGAKRYENRTQEVSAISRGLKALAKELNVPVHRAFTALSRLRAARWR